MLSVIFAAALSTAGPAALMEDSLAIRAFGPQGIAQQVPVPAKIAAYRVAHTYTTDSSGKLLGEWRDGFLGLYPILAVGPELNDQQARRFCAILADSNTYDLTGDRPCICCYLQPECGFKFEGREDTVVVYFGPECEQIVVSRGRLSSVARTRGRIAEIDALLEELFPASRDSAASGHSE